MWTKSKKLGEIINLLEALPVERPIRFDFGVLSPDGLNSYRGDYADLAIGFKDSAQDVTVGTLLKQCREAVGKDYEGYKGGIYQMNESTPVWVANWGESTGTTIKRIVDYGHVAIIETRYQD